MKNQLLIVGSSYVPPIQYVWGTLQEAFDIHFLNIRNWVEILEESNLNKKTIACIFLLEDTTYEDLDEENVVLNIISIIRQRLSLSKSPLVFCFSIRTPSNVITKSKIPGNRFGVYNEIQKLCTEFQHFYTINLDDLFVQIGLNSAYSYRNWYFSNSRLTTLAWSHLTLALSHILTRINLVRKKVLILDCDNTIWGGIVGEDGLSGILLGQDGIGKAYKDFQAAILEIHKSGILLGLASKNNEEDVWSVFDNHSQMVLSKGDFISSKINWDDKASSLLQISAELDLNLDSFVFWDDNPFERDQMRQRLPKVVTIEPPAAVELWPKFLKELELFSNFYITDEDLSKQSQYKSRIEFQKLQKKSEGESSYLRKIKLSATLLPINEQNLSRAEQISMKTNQFNLRSVRFNSNDIREFINKKDNFGYLVHLKDMFGDHGIVALFLVRVVEETAIVEAFNISCRVFGRKLEYWTALKIGELCANLGVLKVVFESIPTDKSRTVISQFLESGVFVKFNEVPNFLLKLNMKRDTMLGENDLFELSRALVESEIEGIYE